jgi:type I restriction enzyme S subunit
MTAFHTYCRRSRRFLTSRRPRNHNLEEQAQALYKSWFVEFEPFKDGKFVNSELGMIPEGWNISPLGKIAEYRKISINPQRFPNTCFHHFSLPAFDNSKEPEIQKGLEIMSNKFVVEDKMVLFSKLNPRIKRLWVLDNVPDNAICSTEFIAYKALNQEMFSYVWCYLNGDSFYDSILSMVNGATGSHQRFHAEDTLNFIVPFNQNVAISFSKLVAPILYSIMENERENRSLKQERDILLPKMMSGALYIDD